MTDMPPDVRAKHDERMMWIGWVCNQWSHLEYIVFGAIRKMLNLDVETAKIVIGGVDLRPRLAMACELANHQSRPAVRAALVEVAEALDRGLLKRRNRAIHGIMFLYTTGEMEVEIHRGKDRARRPLSATDLQHLANDIYDLTVKLNNRINPLLFGHKTRPYALLEKPARQPRKPTTPKQGRKPKPLSPRRRSSPK